MLLHCLYLHLFREDQEDRRLWNLACDIAVEQIISREKIPILETGGDAKKIREKVFHILGDRSDSAETICRKLKEQAFPFHLEELEEAFHFDDHTLWDTCTGEKGKRTKEKWNKLLSYTAANRQDHRKRRGSQKGDQKEEAGTVRSGRYDYKKFLRQFSVLREEVELDTESFDYIFYNYGMEHYGNLPLIEPLEYKEVNRLEELVIAIDTSGSCDGETVRRFLGETYSILSEKENFFHKMKVYLIQCDCCIQDVKVIHSEEEWKEYSKNITIQGRGGTDFRPVFRYVKEQQEKKEIRSLKALIYFTDGDGYIPEANRIMKRPLYFYIKQKKWSLFRPGRFGLWQSRKECVTEHEHKRGKRRDQTYLTGLQPEGCSRTLHISQTPAASRPAYGASRNRENSDHGAGGRGMRGRSGSLYHYPSYKTECGRTAKDRDPVLQRKRGQHHRVYLKRDHCFCV